ncbi:MAG: hypothetical protein WHT27_05450 [candidate division WOR-3 bacterium]
MDIKSIKEDQRKKYILSVEKVEHFINLYPEFKNLRYSLLWATYDSFSENFIYRKKKKNLFSVNLKIKNPKEPFFLSFGNLPFGIIDKFFEKKINNITVRITSSPFGFSDERNLVYSRMGRFPISIKKFDGEHEIENLYKDIIQDNYYDLERFKKMLQKYFSKNLPLFVLVDEDRTKFKKVLIEHFKKEGIKTFVFQHGITPIFESSLPMIKESFAPLNADFFVCWGKASYIYLKNFIPENRIIIGGNPTFEIKCDKTEEEIDLLLIDQQFLGFEEEFEYVYKKIAKMFERLDVNFKVYLRNEYNIRFLKKIFSEDKLIKWGKGKIKRFIERSKIVSGFYSTALLEAMFFCKPVILFDFLNRGDFLGLTKSGMAEIVSDENDFIELYGRLSEKNFEKDYVENKLNFFVEYFGETSSNFIVEKILEKL